MASPGHHRTLGAAVLALASLWGCVYPEASYEPPGRETAARGTSRIGEPALRWPLLGRLSSRFGWRGGHPHEGIDLRTDPGTPIRAAAAGRVKYVGRQRGYGRLVILTHGGALETVYAHNRRNRVTRGARVERGQVIAEVGSSGNATAPHLHFEVRVRGRPTDPLGYLPRRPRSLASR